MMSFRYTMIRNLSLLMLSAVLLSGCGQLKPISTEQSSIGSADVASTETETVYSNSSAKNEDQFPTSPFLFETAAEGTKPDVEISTVYAGEYNDDGTPILDLTYQTATVRIEGYEAAANKIQSDLDQVAQDCADEISQMKQYYFHPESPTANNHYYYEEMLSVERADEQIISFRIWSYSYWADAAHGNYSQCGVSYSTATGERISVSDFGSDVISACEKQSVSLASAYNNYMQKSEDENYRCFSVEAVTNWIEPETGFYFTNDGIAFCSDPYSLGKSFSAGGHTFIISYADLSDILPKCYTRSTSARSYVADNDGMYVYADGTTDRHGEKAIEFEPEHCQPAFNHPE